jgi:hypothetical protein
VDVVGGLVQGEPPPEYRAIMAGAGLKGQDGQALLRYQVAEPVGLAESLKKIVPQDIGFGMLRLDKQKDGRKESAVYEVRNHETQNDLGPQFHENPLLKTEKTVIRRPSALTGRRFDGALDSL